MSQSNEVEVPFGENPSDTAVLLLEAAEKKGLDASVVRTGSRVFYAPEEVVQEAGLSEDDDKKSPAKKAAKKAPAKKTAEKDKE